MDEGPIIEDLHRVREEILKLHNYDIDLLFASFRMIEEDKNNQTVSLAEDVSIFS